MVFIQAILYGDKPSIADNFMAEQPIFEIGSFAMKTPFRVCLRFNTEVPISELGYFATKILTENFKNAWDRWL